MPRSELLLASLMVVSIIAGASTSAAADAWPLEQSTKEKCLQILRTGMHADEFWPSIHAAEGLTLGGYGSEVQEFLAPKLETETDDQKRCGLARELVRAGDRSYRLIMLEILAGDDPHGHVHAAESLYKVREIGDGTAMRHAFQSDDLRLRVMSAAALGRCGNPDAMAFLRGILNGDDPAVAYLAAWVLGRIGDESDIPRLKESLARCEDPLHIAYHQHSLAVLGDADGLAALRANLGSTDEAVRTYAATFAGDAQAYSLQAELLRLLDDPYLDARLRAAQTLLQLDRLHDQDLPTQTVEPTVTLKLEPQSGNPRNSEGDFIYLNDGRVLYVYTHFTDGAGDHSGAHLAGRFSSDGGQTWDSADTLILPNESDLNVMSVSLLRLADGRIALFYLRKNSLEDCRPILRISDDEADTWSEPIGVIPDAENGYYVLNNDRVVQLAGGRLIVPVAQHFGPGQKKWIGNALILCYFSDDGGQSWQRGEIAPAAQDAPANLLLQEPGVVELNDGRLLIFCRTNAGSQFFAESTDQGQTWSQLHGSPLTSPISPASIERIPATGHLLAVWNDHADIPDDIKGKRTPFSVALSQDEGQTWNRVGVVADNPHGWYCYTAVEFVGGDVLLGHCAGDRRRNNGLAESRITRVPVEWLYSSED